MKAWKARKRRLLTDRIAAVELVVNARSNATKCAITKADVAHVPV